MGFPLDRGREVLRRYRTWAAEVPDAFTTIAAVITAPPAPFVPPELVGQKVVGLAGCWCGEPDAGQDALGPLRELQPAFDVFGPMPYPALQGMLDEGAPPGIRSYTRSGYLADLSDGLIDAALEHGAAMPSPFSQLHLHHMGGAVARVGEDDTAFGNRRAAYAYNVNSMWMDPSEDEMHETTNRDVRRGARALLHRRRLRELPRQRGRSAHPRRVRRREVRAAREVEATVRSTEPVPAEPEHPAGPLTTGRTRSWMSAS